MIPNKHITYITEGIQVPLPEAGQPMIPFIFPVNTVVKTIILRRNPRLVSDKTKATSSVQILGQSDTPHLYVFCPTVLAGQQVSGDPCPPVKEIRRPKRRQPGEMREAGQVLAMVAAGRISAHWEGSLN